MWPCPAVSPHSTSAEAIADRGLPRGAVASTPSRRRLGRDDDGTNKARFRLLQFAATAVTVLATAWACTLGVIPAIIALMVAKHVLDAILVMGIGVDAPRPNQYGL